MDQHEFERLFGSPSQPPGSQPDAAPNGPAAPQGDPPSTVEELLAGGGDSTGESAQPAAPDSHPLEPTSLWEALVQGFNGPGVQPEIINRDFTPQEANDLMTGMGVPVATGAMKSVFETKDFLFGDTPRDRQSYFRQGVEDLDAQLKDAHPVIAGLSSGIGQFSTAMIGLGKLGYVAKALPYAGEALAAGETALKGLKYGKVALESGKAALAGSIAFDPHEQRLSNMIQDTPLANPFNAWLAAKPEDSAALGRIKNAMESLGMDAAIIGTFTGALKVMKLLKAGKVPEARRVITQMESEAAKPSSAPEGHPTETVAVGDGPEASMPPPAQEVQPAGTPDTPVTPQRDVLDVATPKEQPAAKPAIEVKPGEVGGILDGIPQSLENAEKDWATLTQHGQWSGAMHAEKKLTPDLGAAFYARFRTDVDIDQFIDAAVTHKASELEAQGFRGKLTDDKLRQQVQAYAALTDKDPAEVYGLLESAGEQSRTLTAKMIVAGSLTAKTFEDASLMAMRMKMGDYAEFGSRAAMEAEIAKRFSLATSLLNITDQIRGQAGRTLRANRGRPFDPSLFEGVSRDRFYDLLAEAEGDPRAIRQLADPGLYRKIMDTVNYMRVSSLVSGPKTQFINLMSNGYMTGVRPLERILGSIPGAVAGSPASRALIKENLRQYLYMGSAFADGFGQAVKAFTRNDGLLKPHSTEAFGERSGGMNAWQVPGTQAFGKGYFRPWDSFGNALYNALSIPLSAAGMPVRLLGTADELVKQIVYRSKLSARAYVEGAEKALDAGLDGKAAKDFIKGYVGDRLANAFDAEGRGLDHGALHEANIATFQQDLLPKTFGRNFQSFLSNDKTQLSRLVLPFIKTPTNVIRYGWKMTPGLNLLQEEYRQMIGGAMGHEAQAQAMGQMTMGSLFMGAASFMTSQGMVTGGGPTDPRLRSQLLATGWQPYSIVVENDDGTKTYVPFNRYDPVALPFGIIADIQDALAIMGSEEGEGTAEVQNAIGALSVSLAKQFTSRTYMLSLNQALEALQDPDRRMTNFAGGIAQSFIPFSGAFRQLSTDPYLRDARSITDKMMQVIPGLGADMRPKYNWLGQPVLNRQGLWSDDNGSLVDREIVRIGLAGGSVMYPPSPAMESFGGKVDLRTITLSTGENAYQKLQELRGQPAPSAPSLRETIAKLMRSEAYHRAPDGDRETKGTRSWLIANMVSRYQTIASRLIKADPNVRDALLRAQRRVVDHYQHLKVEPTPRQQEGLDAILKGYGQRPTQ
jgi:hypothetical protein